MRIFLYCLLFGLIAACEDHKLNENCSVDNPAEDLPWMKAQIESIKLSSMLQYEYITQTSYKGATVYIFGNCCPFCISIFVVKDCRGESVGVVGNGEDDVPMSALDNDILIWKAENSECTL